MDSTSQDFCFRQQDRIKSSEEFRRVVYRGKRRFSKKVEVRYLPNELGRPRIGITVSKKVGNAVRRNKIKRITREWFRLNRHRFVKSVDIVLLYRKTYPLKELETLWNQIEDLLNEIKLLEISPK